MQIFRFALALIILPFMRSVRIRTMSIMAFLVLRKISLRFLAFLTVIFIVRPCRLRLKLLTMKMVNVPWLFMLILRPRTRSRLTSFMFNWKMTFALYRHRSRFLLDAKLQVQTVACPLSSTASLIVLLRNTSNSQKIKQYNEMNHLRWYCIIGPHE